MYLYTRTHLVIYNEILKSDFFPMIHVTLFVLFTAIRLELYSGRFFWFPASVIIFYCIFSIIDTYFIYKRKPHSYLYSFQLPHYCNFCKSIRAGK